MGSENHAKSHCVVIPFAENSFGELEATVCTSMIQKFHDYFAAFLQYR